LATETREYSFTSSTGMSTIYGIACFPQSRKFRGYLQIFHDMHEHIDRYEEVMQFYARQGYVCFGHDHMGHGKSTTSLDQLGCFAGESCEIRIIDDANLMYEKVKEDFPVSNENLEQVLPQDEEKPVNENEPKPIFLHGLIGVGFGATIAKLYLIKFLDINALVLCGDKGPNPFAPFELAYCNYLIRRNGRDAHSQRIDHWIEGRYNKFVENPKNRHEWHSRDLAMVDRFNQDEMCTFEYSLGAYQVLFRLENTWNNNYWYKSFPPFLSTFIISGTYDPVSNYTRNLNPMITKLTYYGAKNIFHTYYEDARHDLFFEINRQEVYSDVLHFFKLIQQKQLKDRNSAVKRKMYRGEKNVSSHDRNSK
jgi:alpha-beta hydrolase superfamily lysophospholipase